MKTKKESSLGRFVGIALKASGESRKQNDDTSPELWNSTPAQLLLFVYSARGQGEAIATTVGLIGGALAYAERLLTLLARGTEQETSANRHKRRRYPAAQHRRCFSGSHTSDSNGVTAIARERIEQQYRTKS